MLTQENSVEIQVLHRQGMSIRAIAKELGLSRNTVRRYLRSQVSDPSYGPRDIRPSKLDPYKPYIGKRIEAAKPHWIPATVLFQEIVAMDYQGKPGILKNYIRQFKPQDAEPVVRFETDPGKQLQVDFTSIRRGRSKIKAFVATLGFSRASYVRFSQYERQQDWLDGIEEALIYFGGVPRDLLFDNAKCIMIERNAYGDKQHRWNPALLAMSQSYGFRLKACRPYRAKTKGKVERFNGYLKHSFITPLAASLKQAGLELDCDIANARIGPWLEKVAHQRIHGTTGEKPQILLDQERQHLLPLPPQAEIKIALKPDHTFRATPVESIQHSLSTYDQLLGAIL
ncbi:MAG: IS21 family transposase [Gammaproteobacteria bacterium]|nr:IS21 family transposase [Gammaproteobacteria bacterium]